MTSIQVDSFVEFFYAVVRINQQFDNDFPWWRGQAESDWKLLPSLYHKNKSDNESNMTVRFKNLAAVRHTTVPNPKDDAGWLFMMQHYGLPTRLLDWTESPLVALYFAAEIENHEGKDGVVWGLRPVLLNERHIGRRGIVPPDGQEARTLLREAIGAKSKHDQEKVVALQSKHTDLRQMVQMSEFTVHGSPRSLDDFIDADSYLAKIVVPAKSKNDCRRSLKILGISESRLFPDLEHLARELASQKYASVGQQDGQA